MYSPAERSNKEDDDAWLPAGERPKKRRKAAPSTKGLKHLNEHWDEFEQTYWKYVKAFSAALPDNSTDTKVSVGETKKPATVASASSATKKGGKRKGYGK